MKNNLIFIFFFIFLAYGCKKELGVYPLNEMKDENPYKGSETLKYLDNNGDTIIFHGNGRYTQEFHSEVDYGRNGEYFVNELDRCSFTEDENNYELFIQLASRTRFIANSRRKTMTGYYMDLEFIDQSEPTNTDCASYVTGVPLPIIDLKDSDFFYDSLLVNGIYYYDVVLFSDNSILLYDGDCSERFRADSIFYCISDGIIKLTFTNNNSWNILK